MSVYTEVTCPCAPVDGWVGATVEKEECEVINGGPCASTDGGAA
jgi:hypothetical protein